MSSQIKRIAVLTTVHDPNDTRIYHRQIPSLIRLGYEVLYLCKEYPKTENGSHIVLLPVFRNEYLRIFLSPLLAFWKAITLKNIAVYHLHDPELIITGLLLRLFGKKVIFDMHEDVPSQLLTKTWIPPNLRKFISSLYAAIERITIKRFNRIITVTEPIVNRLKQDGVTQVSLIRNFPIQDELITHSVKPFHVREYDVVYLGEASVPRGLKVMIEAVLNAKNVNRFAIIGRLNPPDFLNGYQNHPHVDRIHYVGTKTRKDVAELLNNAKIGLVPLPDNPNNIVGYPTKIFEYMACSLPVIASKLPLIQEIQENAQCALLYDSTSVEELSSALDSLLQDEQLMERLGKNGRKAVVETYSWEAEEQHLAKAYLAVLGETR